VLDKLEKWIRHATIWAKSEGPQWTRHEGSKGYEWRSSCGQIRSELRPPRSSDIERQRTRELGEKTVSRLPKAAVSCVLPGLALSKEGRGGEGGEGEDR
ncbi:MAG: hypothetical protein SGPRY_007478, partial [Prymnesium sp.]